MAKKDGPIKLPKTLAGVKIPRSVRKGAIADFLASKAGQKLVAEVVTAAVGAVLVRRQAKPGSVTRKTARKAKAKAGDVAEAVSDAAPAASLGAGSLAFAFSEAGRAFRDALQGSDTAAAPEPPDADWPADFEAPSTTNRAQASKASEAETPGKPH